MRQAFQVLMSRLPSADNGPRPKNETSLDSEDRIFLGRQNELVLFVKYLPNFNIRVLLERVNVASDRTFEEHGLLRDDTEPRPQIMES